MPRIEQTTNPLPVEPAPEQHNPTRIENSSGHLYNAIRTIVNISSTIYAYSANYLSHVWTRIETSIETIQRINHDVIVNSKLPYLLYKAIDENNLQDVHQYLNEGVNIETTRMKQGFTPLMCAISKQNKDMVALLLERGANTATLDKEGYYTPLMYAISIREVNEGRALAELLLDRGADINQRNKEGTTAIHYAILCHYPIEPLHLRGAELDIKNNKGETPLMVAARVGDLDTIKYLINMGSNINQRSSNGKSVLTFAIQSNSLQNIKYLLRKGINADLILEALKFAELQSNINPEILTFLRAMKAP